LLGQLGPQMGQFSTDIYNAAQRRYQQGMLAEAQAKRKYEEGATERMQEALTRYAAMRQPSLEDGTVVAPRATRGDLVGALGAGGFSPSQAVGILSADTPEPDEGKWEKVETDQGLFVLNAKTGALVPASADGSLKPKPRRPEISASTESGATVFSNKDTGATFIVPFGEVPDPEKWTAFIGNAPPQVQPQPAQAQAQAQAQPPVPDKMQIFNAVKPGTGAASVVLKGFEGTVGQAAGAEMNPDVSASAQYLTNVANKAATAFTGPGRESVQEQEWARSIINIPDSNVKNIFQNPSVVTANIYRAREYANGRIAEINKTITSERGRLPPTIYAGLYKEKIELEALVSAINSTPKALTGSGKTREEVMGGAP
jgi:hypothetical protein